MFDFVMTTYLNNTINSVIIRPNGCFEQKFPIQYRQDIGLYLNDDAISFTVQDQDTLTINWDDRDFKNTFLIKGKNENRSKELQLQLKLYTEFRKPFLDLYEIDKKQTAEEKYIVVNELYNRTVKMIVDSTGFFSQSSARLITSLYFQFTNFLYQQRLIPQFKLKLTLDSIQSQPYYAMRNIPSDNIELNEMWFWSIPEYRDFIFNYVRTYRPFNSFTAIQGTPKKLFNPTDDEFHLANANIHLINIKDWFITNSIIFGFGHYEFANAEKVYKEAINAISSSYLKDTLQKYYSAMHRLKPGNPAPGFALKNENEETVSLSSFKGKVVYIDFWGIGCGPCINDIKNYVPKLHEIYKNKEIVFINICVDSKKVQWKEALKKYKLDGVNLIAEGWSSHPVCKAYNVISIPHYILIDKTGKIVNNNASGPYRYTLQNSKNEIDVLLK